MFNITCIREIQTMITMRYHYIFIKTVKIINGDNVKSWKDVEKINLSYIAMRL